MAVGSSQRGSFPGRSRWLSLGAVGLFAVVAGLILPQLITSVAPERTAAHGTEKQERSPLAYTPPAWPEAPDPKAMLGRLALGTAIVLALCVVTLAIGRRWLRGTATAGTDQGRIQLVETLTLGNRCNLHLVKIGGQQVLVGLDGGGLKAMVTLTEPFADRLLEMQTLGAAGAAEEERSPTPAPALPG
jgi:flagellar biogenesis protein FliO